MIENNIPVLPLRDIVVFPHMVVPLFVGRDKSVKALEKVMAGDKRIMLITQKSASVDDPKKDDLFDFGTIANVLQLLKLPDGTVKVLVEGLQRASINMFTDNEDYLVSNIDLIDENNDSSDKKLRALSKSITDLFDKYVNLNKKIPPEVLGTINEIDDLAKLSDTIASHLSIKLSDKQEILEAIDLTERFEKIMNFIQAELDVMQVEKKIRGRVKNQMEKTQREYYLNEQMKAIQKELGEGDDGKDDIQEYEEKIENTKLSKEAKEKCYSEIKKLKSMSPMSAESSVIRNYLDWILTIPWGKKTKVKKDIKFAESVLNEDHYGLEKVKERILEYLAVQQRIKKMKGPILCLVGAPGVGKTSLGKSIARATGRKFVRMSLGGVRDEAEIRGHRRTYIGSLPGKVLQMMKKAGSSNPLFLLDEIDKLGADYRGDPSSALLEVLDPEQNNSFNDHYLEVDYDLSDTMFITTANTLRMPPALLDRMEIIRIAGYTEDEKVEIVKQHLAPQMLEKHGLKSGELILDDSAITGLIRYYTREAGVRSLERELANLARKTVKKIVAGDIGSLTINEDNLHEFAGVRKFKFGEIDNDDQVGIVTGLAWTEVGGDILPIESVIMPGKGRMTITGKLGDVMKESIQAAKSYVRSRCIEFGIKPTIFPIRDIHIHVPEGAIPKDGPSAGLGMVTSIVSVLTGIPVRKDIAMTGEVTLRGKALGIGGLKEKLLAALRAGTKTVIIPKENEKDMADIPDNVKDGLELIFVDNVDEVLKIALTKPLLPIEWDEEDSPKSSSDISEDDADQDVDNPITH
ncbi:MAG: Lon protease [Candidatus Pelagibacterales bacterium]|nr:MAG: Lon protease [Pelagibacterales bacterium]|tara:strand:- start:502 stop:2910 length:2409 start_codon:yes stop_codon:yes gene_type:complete